MRIFKFRFSHIQSQNSLTDCTLIYTHTHTHTHAHTHIQLDNYHFCIYIYYNLHVSTHIKFHDIKVCSTVILKRTAIIPSVIEKVQDLKYRQKRLHSLLLFQKLLLHFQCMGARIFKLTHHPHCVWLVSR